MNNLWNRSVGPFDEAAAQRHRHMGLLDCNGDVNADAVNFLAHLCAGLQDYIVATFKTQSQTALQRHWFYGLHNYFYCKQKNTEH